jgi:hypothetical protein
MTMVGGPLPAVMTTGATVVVVVATGPTEETARVVDVVGG